MKKSIIVLASSLLLLSSCDSYDQFNGVATGSMLGGIFGSSIGGLMEGPRGSDAGTLVGMIVGGAVGAAVTSQHNTSTDNEAYDTDNGAYSRPDESAYSRPETGSVDQYSSDSQLSGLRIENVRFVDTDKDKAVGAGEECQIIFNIYNRGAVTLYNVAPVITVEGTKRILLSPTAIVGDLTPGQGVRYTASVVGRSNLKTGIATFHISFIQGKTNITARTFQLNTKGK